MSKLKISGGRMSINPEFSWILTLSALLSFGQQCSVTNPSSQPVKSGTIPADNSFTEPDPPLMGTPAGKLSVGNLRKITLQGGNGHYVLTGTLLNRLSDQPVMLVTADRSFAVRVTFLRTVLVSQSLAVRKANQILLQNWAQGVPLVAHILEQRDSIGSMKPLIYELIQPKENQDLQLQEELVLLWSADPIENSKIGDTKLYPPVPFPGRLVDVQYRGMKEPRKELIGKIVLQILYIRDKARTALLGAFLIVSKPNGEYEFYAVPQGVLKRIVIDCK
jgi:hypothetical protein